ncbi:unnamed protein product [Symbiodinium sp. CCMP2592]|nr:unnamed protein product [Symbiodinium sp. CCMP2592]
MSSGEEDMPVCRCGHMMRFMHTSTRTWFCAGCEESKAACIVRYHCEECHHDACDDCIWATYHEMGLHQQQDPSESEDDDSEHVWHAEYCDIGSHHWHRSDTENSEGESAGSSHFDDPVGITRPDDVEVGVAGTCNPERHDHQDEDAYWYGWEEEDYLVIPRDDWEEPHYSGHDSEASASTGLDPKTDPTQAIKDMLNVKGAGA